MKTTNNKKSRKILPIAAGIIAAGLAAGAARAAPIINYANATMLPGNDMDLVVNVTNTPTGGPVQKVEVYDTVAQRAIGNVSAAEIVTGQGTVHFRSRLPQSINPSQLRVRAYDDAALTAASMTQSGINVVAGGIRPAPVSSTVPCFSNEYDAALTAAGLSATGFDVQKADFDKLGFGLSNNNGDTVLTPSLPTLIDIWRGCAEHNRDFYNVQEQRVEGGNYVNVGSPIVVGFNQGKLYTIVNNQFGAEFVPDASKIYQIGGKAIWEKFSDTRNRNDPKV
jgi:hypothetical protein